MFVSSCAGVNRVSHDAERNSDFTWLYESLLLSLGTERNSDFIWIGENLRAERSGHARECGRDRADQLCSKAELSDADAHSLSRGRLCVAIEVPAAAAPNRCSPRAPMFASLTT
jgi:hypothetical protein